MAAVYSWVAILLLSSSQSDAFISRSIRRAHPPLVSCAVQERNLYLHEDDESRKICYDLVLGEKEKVNIAVLPYLYTTKNQGISAQVEGWCRREGHTYVCADYHGVSQSAGRGDDGTLTRWIADTIEVLENAVPGSRTILVGAAVGAWVMLRVAMQRPDLVAGLVGISCDPDFTEELLWAQLSEEDKDAIMEKVRPSPTPNLAAELEPEHRFESLSGYLNLTSGPNSQGKHEITWGDTQYVISKDLILDGRRNLVLQEGQNSLPIQVPVRLIHGTADEEVPLSTALRILDAVETDDAEVCILKGMSHFMQADGEFKALRSSLSAVVEASSNYGPFPLDCPGSG